MAYSKEVWGNNIWYLFHSIAHKIKESEFSNVKNDLSYLLNTISSNLPCPECSADAVSVLNKVNFNNISSKEEFKKFVFNFHNHVNKKLNKPLFEYEKLDEKYKDANIKALYHNFNIIFTSNSNIPQLMSASFHRQQTMPKINFVLNSLLDKME